MYSYNRLKKLLEENTIDYCFGLWVNSLDSTISYFYYETEHGEKPDYKNPSKFKTHKGFIKDTIRVLDLFVGNCDIANKTLTDAIGKIVSYELFTHMPKPLLKQEELIKLLDIIKWNCDILFQYNETWISDESDFGYDFAKLMNLAKKYNRVVTGHNKKTILYGLLSVVYYCGDTDATYAEKYIIDNNIKLNNMGLSENELSDKNFESLKCDMIENFNEIGYNLQE